MPENGFAHPSTMCSIWWVNRMLATLMECPLKRAFPVTDTVSTSPCTQVLLFSWFCNVFVVECALSEEGGGGCDVMTVRTLG